MTTLYKVVLSLHLIAVISWMAGLLYLFRLFVYHTEESEAVVMARFRVMEDKLYKIITAPAMAVTFVAGAFLLSLNPELLTHAWMHAKLALVVAMGGVTGYAGSLRKKLAAGSKPLTSKQLRLLNEVPTLLMIGIVFLVILK